MVAHPATSTILPQASMVAHQAQPCTSATVTLVAHQGVETFTRSSGLVQLCTMQHQDTFTSHSATPYSTTGMLSHALKVDMAKVAQPGSPSPFQPLQDITLELVNCPRPSPLPLFIPLSRAGPPSPLPRRHPSHHSSPLHPVIEGPLQWPHRKRVEDHYKQDLNYFLMVARLASPHLQGVVGEVGERVARSLLPTLTSPTKGVHPREVVVSSFGAALERFGGLGKEKEGEVKENIKDIVYYDKNYLGMEKDLKYVKNCALREIDTMESEEIKEMKNRVKEEKKNRKVKIKKSRNQNNKENVKESEEVRRRKGGEVVVDEGGVMGVGRSGGMSDHCYARPSTK